MRGVIVCIIVLASIAAAWAQTELRQRLAVTRAVEAFAEARADANVNVRLNPNQTVYLREVAGDFARIDADGVAGPAYVPIDAVEVRPPLILRQGVCDCPNDVQANGRLCGRRSSFCQPGGRETACALDGRRFEDACGATAPTP